MLDKMPEEKLKKVIVGVTVAGTLLLTFLFAVIIYQFVCMGVRSSQIKTVQNEINKYQEEKEKLKDNLGYYESDDYKEWIARDWGYIYPDDQTEEQTSGEVNEK